MADAPLPTMQPKPQQTTVVETQAADVTRTQHDPYAEQFAQAETLQPGWEWTTRGNVTYQVPSWVLHPTRDQEAEARVQKDWFAGIHGLITRSDYGPSAENQNPAQTVQMDVRTPDGHLQRVTVPTQPGDIRGATESVMRSKYGESYQSQIAGGDIVDSRIQSMYPTGSIAYRAEVAARDRPGYYGLPGEGLPEAKTAGDTRSYDIAKGLELMSMFGMAAPIYSKSREAPISASLESLRRYEYATGDVRSAQYYSGELQKVASRPVERASEYHYLGMASGIAVPANPWEYQGDLAVEFLKGYSNTNEKDWFSPVSGEMEQFAPGMGLQEWSWQVGLNTDNPEKYQKAADVSFMPAVMHLAETEGKYGPYGYLFGGPQYEGTPSSEGIRKQEDFVFTPEAQKNVETALEVSRVEREQSGVMFPNANLPEYEEPMYEFTLVTPEEERQPNAAGVPWWADYPQNKEILPVTEGRIRGEKTVASVGVLTDLQGKATGEANISKASVENEYKPSGFLGLGGLLPELPTKEQTSVYLNLWGEKTRADPIGSFFGLQKEMAEPVVSTLGGVASQMTFGLSELVYKPKTDEWGEFVEGSGRVARFVTGQTEAKQEAYFETIKNETGLLGEAKRGVFYIGTELTNKPAELAPAALTGVAFSGAGTMAPSALRAMGFSGKLPTIAKVAVAAGFTGIYGASVVDVKSAEKTKENVYRSVPTLAAMYAGAGGMNWIGDTEIAVGGFGQARETSFAGVSVGRDVFFGLGRAPTGQRYAGAFSLSGNEFYGLGARPAVVTPEAARPLGLPDLSAKAAEPRYTTADIGCGWEKPVQLPPGREVVAAEPPRYAPSGITYDLESLTISRLKPEYEFREKYKSKLPEKPFEYAPSVSGEETVTFRTTPTPEPLMQRQVEPEPKRKLKEYVSPEATTIHIEDMSASQLIERGLGWKDVELAKRTGQITTTGKARAKGIPKTLLERGGAFGRVRDDDEIIPAAGGGSWPSPSWSAGRSITTDERKDKTLYPFGKSGQGTSEVITPFGKQTSEVIPRRTTDITERRIPEETPRETPWEKIWEQQKPTKIITELPGTPIPPITPWLPSLPSGGSLSSGYRKGSRAYTETLGFEYSKRTDPFRKTKKRKLGKWGRI